MPLVIDLLLLDEGRGVPPCEGGGRFTTGEGVFAEVERQLEDGNSHLRRKSAFGALVARGSSIRFVRCERHERCPAEAAARAAAIVTPAADEAATPLSACGSTPSRHDAGGSDVGEWSLGNDIPTPLSDVGSSPQTPLSRVALAPATVPIPLIHDFPRGAGPSSQSRVIGASFFGSLFGWWPSCAPPPCKPAAGQVADTCTIVFADQPEVLAHCLPLPARHAAAQEDTSTSQHEAGLGGWPLSVPHAFVAFPEPPSGGLSIPVGSRSGFPLTAGPGKGCTFSKAAVEVDDSELLVVVAPARAAPGLAKSSQAAAVATTPSTASTADPSSTPLSSAPCCPSSFTRLVFPRDQVGSLKLWPAADGVTFCNTLELARDAENTSRGIKRGANVGAEPPWPHVVEISGRPQGSQQSVPMLIALPCSSLAARLHDALTRRRLPQALRQSPSNVASGVASASASGGQANDAAGGSGPHGAELLRAVRCELHISARLDISSSGQAGNCSAVVRRSICEACHIASERVRVCGLREGDGGPVAIDPVRAPLFDALPPPVEAYEVPPMPPQLAAPEIEVSASWSPPPKSTRPAHGAQELVPSMPPRLAPEIDVSASLSPPPKSTRPARGAQDLVPSMLPQPAAPEVEVLASLSPPPKSAQPAHGAHELALALPCPLPEEAAYDKAAYGKAPVPASDKPVAPPSLKSPMQNPPEEFASPHHEALVLALAEAVVPPSLETSPSLEAQPFHGKPDDCSQDSEASAVVE